MSITALWAKKTTDGPYWLPLEVHLRDTAEVAKMLWRDWIPENVKRIIIESIGGDEQDAERFFVFLAFAHDIGKATPVFQAKCSFPPTDLDRDIYNALLMGGFIVKERRKDYRFYQYTPHALASQLILENAKNLQLSGTNLNKNASIILGAHHGKPPDTGYEQVLYAYAPNFGHDDMVWLRIQTELIQLALETCGYKTLEEIPAPLVSGQVLLSSLIIVADWIASNTGLLPLISFEWQSEVDSIERVRIGWDRLSLPGAWDPYYDRYDESLYTDRFGDSFKPNEVQKAAINAANDLRKPGIMVIEAPMGLGKTEAALVVAEVYRNRAECGGLFFALPTQATSDGIFPRLLNWLDNLDLTEPQSVRLAHGKAQFNKDYTGLQLFHGDSNIYENDETDERLEYAQTVIAHQWFNGRKRALLANFVVGTIDQLLLMALKQKHVMLRHLGLAGKVVIIDECHAYDAYMSHYLKMALAWLGSYNVPVIILSATLTMDSRRGLIGAYLGQESITGDWAEKQEYPLITYTDGNVVKSCSIKQDVKSRVVIIKRLALENVTGILEGILSSGGCAGVIMDTVHRAQDMADDLRQCFGTDIVILVHSRFITPDRLELEKRIRDSLGKTGKRPVKLIVVGTQVLEQSLDIDFDVMITDIAPMDLLLQRLGRLHRHDRNRPDKLSLPTCYITGIEEDGFGKGIDNVYDEHLLIRTRDLLDSQYSAISLPDEIARLVNTAYDKDAPPSPEKDNWEKKIQNKESKADSFRMRKPMRKANKTIKDWLNTDIDEKYGEASVRDSFDAVEVLVIKKSADGFSMIKGKKLPSTELDDELARELACQSISLPRELSNMKAIEELRISTNKNVSTWQSSPWITGELFLILDDNNMTTLYGHGVTYSSLDGLRVESATP